MDWKIHYDGGNTFSSEDGSPRQAFGQGVQVILQRSDDSGVEVLEGCDYYIQRGNRWIGVDLVGLIDQLVDCGLVKIGRTLTRAEYQAVLQRALHDPDMPRKSGWAPNERRD